MTKFSPQNLWAKALALGGVLVILAPVFANLDLKLALSLGLSFGFLLVLGVQTLIQPSVLSDLNFKSPFVFASVIYFAVLLLSWLFSPYASAGTNDIWAQAGWIIAGLCAAVFPMDVRQRRFLALCWLGAACLVALYALAQRLGLDPSAVYASAGSRDRAMSVFGNPTFLAAFLVMVWPVALIGISCRGAINCAPTLFVRGAAVLLMWVALGATQSRAGLLALGAQFVICLVGAHSCAPLRGWNKWKVAAFVAVVVFMFWFFLPASMWTRPTLRLELWKATLDLGIQRPLLGWGPGSFVLGFSENLTPALRAALTASNQFAEHPHNFILSLFWEGGLLLLAAFGAVLFVAFRTARNSKDRVWSAALMLGLVGLLVQNLFDRNLKLAGSGFFLWVFLGFLSAGDRRVAASPRLRVGWTRFAGVVMIVLACVGLWQAARPLIAYQDVKSAPDVLAQGREQAPQDEQQIMEILKKDPNNAPLWQTLGDVRAKQAKFGPAAEAYRRCLALDPKASGALLNLGNCLFQTGNLKGAEQTFFQAVRLNSQSVDAHFNLGYAYFYERKMKQAVAEFDEVLRLQPGHAKAMVMKEQILR
jgi:tetratricopeptide (TPR) repeat protein